MTRAARSRASAGLALFVALSFLGSWFVAATLRVFALSVEPASVGTRLFTTSVLYALTMGWQPVVATWLVRRWVDPPDQLDLGLRPGRRVFSLVGGLGAMVFALAAALVAALAVALGVAGPEPFNGAAEAELAAGLPYVVHGVDAGLRSAAFGPAGWLVLLAVIGGLLLSRWRSVVRLPERLMPLPEPATGLLVLVGAVLAPAEGRRPPRVLH